MFPRETWFMPYSSYYYHQFSLYPSNPPFMLCQNSNTQFHQNPMPLENPINLLPMEKPTVQELENQKKKSTKMTNDPDFKCTEGKKKMSSTEQKQGRNTASNILRTFCKFIHDGKLDGEFQRIKMRWKLEIEKKEFLKWIQSIGLTYRNYIKVNWIGKKLKASCKNTKMFLCLLKFHLTSDAKLHILTSTKIKKENIILSLERTNTILQELIFQITSELFMETH